MAGRPELLVLSKAAVMEYEPSSDREICISITDPSAPDVPLSRRFADVLRLAFTDIAAPTTFHFDVLFDTTHARAIVEFVDRWPDVDRIVIHCVAGQSRSPGVALALCDRFGLPTSDLQERFPHWNTWVRTQLARCLRQD
jgi:predicted protein tyrosine phosphatase